ncbi:MAG TPA: fibronectin type III domain-containing protein [Thermoanaerobaculia bacterium]|nr:fibronectin type III domain-containing protein [Thermoanaerobaculia bacterium]
MASKRRLQTWGGITAVCCLAVLAAGVPDAQSSIQVRPLVSEPALQKTAVVEKSVSKLDSATGKACVLMNMACGQTVTGQLSADDCELDDGSFADFWEFQGTSGRTVTVTMTSNAVDAYLFLLDPNDNVIGEDDDSAGGTNARIVQTLTTSGNFAIVANSLTANETGSYTVTLACQGGGGGGALAAPSNLQATSVSGSEVQLTWNDNSTSETGFRIEVRQGASGTFTQVGTVGANVNGAIVNGLNPGTSYSFRVRATNGTNNSAYSNVATVTTQSGDGYFTDPEFPGFRFRVRIVDQGSGQTFQGRREADCINDTVCVSGQVAGRTEAFIRIIGPRPNGFLWPTIVRFTPSRVEVDIQQTGTGVTKTYILPAVGPNDDNLSGIQDREGFLP